MADSSTPTPLSSSLPREDFLCGVVEGFYGRPWTLEQRKDLFAKLKKFGMNTYLYAPKDDLKHRACWRELYSVEEAEQLATLMNNAKSQNILFIYALSPGLDIVYSNPKDIAALKRKLDQVKQLGEPAFALLFDDIDIELNASDKEVFNSFASAQVAVTNEVYDHLKQPTFLFCPTEYCSSRAVPSVSNSEYLATIGSKLSPNIDVMWTGTRVISQTIRLSQIQELSEVLRRKPVIWDNLHANDYDQKRLFLGPYSGRSTKLLMHLKGVLTNPNNEMELDFIPIHTLAQWAKSSSDANENPCSDVKLESELENGSIEDIPTELNPNVYHPKNALRISINEWISEFYKVKNPEVPNKSSSGMLTHSNSSISNFVTATAYEQTVISSSPNIVKSSTTIGTDTEKEEPMSKIEGEENAENNLLNKENIQSPNLEPMDCNPSPEHSPKLASLDVPMVENSKEESSTAKSMTSVDSAEEMQTEVTSLSEVDEETKANMLTYEDLALLVDLFYLPFEHGAQGVQILLEFHWLKTNGYVVSEHRRKRSNEVILSSEINEWYERAAKFNDITLAIGRLLTRLTFCKNRSLLYELYPYVWDIKGVISLLNSYVKWIGFSKGYREAFQSGEQEPWLFRGGLTGELQRLLPVETASDLFVYPPPESPTTIYTIRPYLSSDKSKVYDIFLKNFVDCNTILDDQQSLIGDKCVGGFLTLNEACFVVEDTHGTLYGYALAADAKNFYDCNDCKRIPDPEVIYKNHPSLLNLSPMYSLCISVAKRMLACVIAALKANGSKGVYCRIVHEDKKSLDFYIKLGFQVLHLSNSAEKDDLYVGRIF